MYKYCMEQKIVNRRIPGVENDIPHEGCMLAHLKAIRQAWLDGNELALICEDDADLSDYKKIFDRTNEILISLPSPAKEDWEIIQLQYTGPAFLNKLARFIHKGRIPNTLVKGYQMGAVAYLINRRGMKKFLELMTNQDSRDIARYSRNFTILPMGRSEEFIYAHLNTYFSLYPVINYTVEISTIDPTSNYYVPIKENFAATLNIFRAIEDKSYTIQHYHEMADNQHWIHTEDLAIEHVRCLLPNCTALGDMIRGWNMCMKDHQLHRCEKHKKYEAQLLLELPEGSSFLDVGCHYGDTVVTMALHAKEKNRDDIKFFAFEPSEKKCDYLNRMCRINNLDITVFNKCVGNKKGSASAQEDEQYGYCSYKELKEGKVKIMTLDSIRELVHPAGLIHIDVEGWEPKVLEGASTILDTSGLLVIAECWDGETSKKRGFSESPEEDIVAAMDTYAGTYERLEDLEDAERNLVFRII